jgi:hypothetical protein
MPIQSYTVGPGSLVFGDPGTPEEMAAQITKCSVVPSVDVGDDTPVLSGEVDPGERTYTYVLSGEFLQDITETGISTWTYENAGVALPFIYVPNDAKARHISGTVIVDPTTIGGDVKTKAKSEFEFGVVGTPALGDVEA